jgi:hypothetical protein
MFWTPVEEIALVDGKPPVCLECKKQLEGEAAYDGIEEGYYCVRCYDTIENRLAIEAKEFAEKNCRFSTDELPTFDPSYEHKPTTEEYEMGDRDAHTENAYRDALRHECTNYDELLADLDSEVVGGTRIPRSIKSAVLYEAIRTQIDQMIDNKIVQDDLIRIEEEEAS